MAGWIWRVLALVMLPVSVALAADSIDLSLEKARTLAAGAVCRSLAVVGCSAVGRVGSVRYPFPDWAGFNGIGRADLRYYRATG